MGRTSKLMTAWWHEEDQGALRKLIDRGACYSGTRHIGNAVGAFGEFVVCRALGGKRQAQASGEGDCLLPNGRMVEVKATSDPRAGWNLRYDPSNFPGTDYALVRIDPADWRVTEAWLVPAAVAATHATGWLFRMAPRGAWREASTPLSLNRH